MKKIVFILLFFAFFGCAKPPKPCANCEYSNSVIELQKATITFYRIKIDSLETVIRGKKSVNFGKE